MLNDETLRDGLQSPSVRMPPIDEKIDILRHMDALGIDTADIGLPGAGPKVVEDVNAAGARHRRRADGDPRQLRRPHRGGRYHADRRDRAAHRRADRMLRLHRLEPDPSVCRRLDARLPAEVHRGGDRLRRRSKGSTVMYVTEDTTRADPE